jgi:hypothetical protein
MLAATRAVLVAGLISLALAVGDGPARAQRTPKAPAGLGEGCGYGFIDRPCAKGLMCDRSVGTPEQCFLADYVGICVNPSACTTPIQPVCGCDGKTYARDCDRQQAAVGKLHEGACKPGGSSGR